MSWIQEAVVSGARRFMACELLGISIRTLQRWMPRGAEQMQSDLRPLASRPKPSNALSTQEQEQIIAVCNQPEYAALPVSQIVPKLADKGVYIASESTMYRVLKDHDQLAHRRRSKVPCPKVPPTHLATGPKQLWAWDISYLPTRVKGIYYYLYLIEDLFSRCIVMADIHEAESAQLASELVEKAILKECCSLQRPILHSDNGSPMKAALFLNKLNDLGVKPSRSRPSVSDDNAYIESLFKTLKYCPQYPKGGFHSLEQARQWLQEFIHWYNHEHQHSRIRFVTPIQRHLGQDQDILKARQELYLKAKLKHPERWAKNTRNWAFIDSVVLNPVSQSQLIALERRISN
jgi:putative transposase